MYVENDCMYIKIGFLNFNAFSLYLGGGRCKDRKDRVYKFLGDSPFVS